MAPKGRSILVWQVLSIDGDVEWAATKREAERMAKSAYGTCRPRAVPLRKRELIDFLNAETALCQ